jgi:hypothetical protein
MVQNKIWNAEWMKDRELSGEDAKDSNGICVDACIDCFPGFVWI